MGNIFKQAWDFFTKGAVATLPLSPSTYHREGTPFGKDFWLFNPDGSGNDVFISLSTGSDPLAAYTDCPPYAAIIEQKAQAFINGITYVMNTQGKESNSTEAKKIRALFRQPNKVQIGSHFEAQVYINTYLFGYTIILPIFSGEIKPFGFPNYEATSMWAVPGNMISIEETKELFYKENARIINKVVLNYKGEKTILSLDDVIIIRDFRPSFTSVILPDPRSKSLAAPISNIVGAMESRGALIHQRGPRFLISSDQKDSIGTTPLQDSEKNELQRQFAARYGLKRGQSQAIISGNNLMITPVGFDVKQLGLMEEVQESSSMLCIGLGFPKFLAGLSDPTFNNQDTAEKALYLRFVIPDSKSIYEQWNAAFNTQSLNLRIEKDYSTLAVLQGDKKAEAEARLTRNTAMIMELERDLMTVNRFLELSGEDTVTGGDVYFSEWKKIRGIDQQQTNNGQQQEGQQDQGKNGKAKHIDFKFFKVLEQ